MSESSSAPLTYVLQIVGSADAMRQLRAVSDQIRQLGDESAQSSAKVESTSVSITQLATEIGTSANQFNSAIKSASGLYFQYDALEKVELRVEKAERGLTSARAGLLGAQNALNELVGKGIESGPQYEEAQLRVQAAQDALRIKTEELGMAQENLSEAQFKFALSVIPTSISAVSSFAGGVKTLQGSMLVARLSSIDLSGAIWGTNTSLHATPIASAMAATGVRGFGLAVKTTMLSIGPLGWALIGITTALTLVSTNAFGVRDAIHAMGKAIGDAIPVLRPFLEWLGEASRALFPDAGAEAEKMGAGVSSSMEGMATSTQTSTSSQGASLEELKAQFTSTKETGSQEFDALADSLNTEINRMISDVNRAKAALEDLHKASGTSPSVSYISPAAPSPAAQTAAPETVAQDLRKQIEAQEALVRRLGAVPAGQSLERVERLVNEGRVGQQLVDEFRKLEALKAQAAIKRDIQETLAVGDTLQPAANRTTESLGVSDTLSATVTRASERKEVASPISATVTSPARVGISESIGISDQLAGSRSVDTVHIADTLSASVTRAPANVPKITVHVYIGEREVARTINLELGDMAG
ncbi:hypothetical protein [Nitrososphaera sp.]|uniref:hypothetical protein n=1 Tax=Nitrososphaera sp. TaxID=1971748 RepID=UPI0017A2AD38|nr:hypothetical protein [Nitrososphaera sp.]NWG38075.1 hypothetical protein [Nitrososphaera sp.]